ncbi:MAG: sugar phosphate isomerase/epimerase [Acidobacteria bacterium]|nr:sugar phosphate isomerase/epimerase [Acidobacteriota bacterium]
MGSSNAVQAAGAAAQTSAAAVRPRLGLDTFSIGAQNWTPMQILDFAARMKIDVVQFSEIRFLGSADWKVALEPSNLRAIRTKADELGLKLEVGMRSIGPTSGSFDKAAGTAEEQILRMVEAAKILGSPLMRCFQGTQADRSSNIDRHIDETVKVLRSVRTRVVDSGVKIAVENHAGDMQARELKRLIEESGRDFVGATIDSGNAMWTIEDPHLTLEVLAPYVLTSHMRDSYVFNSERGTAVQWCRMGDGNIDMEGYLRKFVAQCPGKTINLEVIVQGSPRLFNYRDPQAWEIFQTTPAWEWARFLARVEKGEPRPLPPPAQGRGGGAPGGGGGRGQQAAGAPGGGPAGAGRQGGGGGGRGGAPNPEAQRINLEHAEASIRWTQGFLATL